MRDKVLLAVVFAAAVLAWLPSEHRSVALAFTSGTTATASFQVTVNVPATGGITSYSNLNFPDFDNSTAVDATTNVGVTVSQGTPYTVSLDYGSHYDGSSREMAAGGGAALTRASALVTGIPYQLWKEAGQSNEWGDSDTANTYPAGSSVAGNGSGSEDTYTIYGHIPTMGSAPSPGFYSDFVTITLNF